MGMICGNMCIGMKGFGCGRCHVKVEKIGECPVCGDLACTPWDTCHNCGKDIWGWDISYCPIIDDELYCRDCAIDRFGFQDHKAPDSLYRRTYTCSSMNDGSVQYVSSLESI